MKRNRIISCFIGAGLAAITATSPAIAGVTVDVLEVGGDVVTTASGSFDISLWEFDAAGSVIASMNPSGSFLVVGASANINLYATPTNFAGPANGFGTGVFIVASSGTGDIFGMQLPPSNPLLLVPTGYVSGDPLSGDGTYNGQSFASLGLTEGVFTWTWNTADGRGDFFTINVVPAPGAFALLGVAGLVSRRRRRA